MLMNRMFHDDANLQIEGRISMQQEAIGLIKANPLGVGLRNYRTRISHEFVHNLFLLIAAEAGVLALVSFVLILIVLFFKIVRSTRLGVVSVNNLALAILVSFFAFLIASLSSPDYLIDHPVAMSFWIVAGLMVALERMAERIIRSRAAVKSGMTSAREEAVDHRLTAGS
jgi:O-antigen ligase